MKFLKRAWNKSKLMFVKKLGTQKAKIAHLAELDGQIREFDEIINAMREEHRKKVEQYRQIAEQTPERAAWKRQAQKMNERIIAEVEKQNKLEIAKFRLMEKIKKGSRT